MRKTILTHGIIVCLVIGVSISSSIAQNSLEIIPQVDNAKVGSATNYIIDGDSGSVWDRVNQQAKNLDTKEQIVSGIMTRDTLLDYAVIVLRFLSQAGIAIGALMFIYTGYLYIMSVIQGSTEPSKDYIKHAIIGILVIIFSYAIMRILTRTFLV